MKISPHDMLEIRNTATLQSAKVEVLEIYSYNGQVILFGERRRYDIWVPSRWGHQQPPPGPTCFPIFPAEPAGNIVKLRDQLNSLPLYLIFPSEGLMTNSAGQAEQFVPILSLQDGHIVLGGERYDKNDMIERSRKLIDLYFEWLDHGETVPEKIRLAQDAVKARN